MDEIVAIVPAAGLSKRFGGPNKLLVEWNGKSVIRGVVEAIQSADIPVTLITGRDAADVEAAAQADISVFNPSFEEGLGTSIAAGVAASPDAAGWLIVLGDQVGIDTEAIAAVIDAAKDAGGEAIVVTRYADQPNRFAHPIVIGSACRSLLLDLIGDEGAKTIIQANLERVVVVERSGRLDDLDALRESSSS